MCDLNVIISGDVNIFPTGADSAWDETVRQFAQMLAKHPGPPSKPEDWDKDGDELERDGIRFDPDDIVAVVHPMCGVSAMTVTESRAVLDVFEGDEMGCCFPLLDLQMTFKPDSLVTVEGRKYLTGTAVVFAAIGGDTVSLNGEDIHLVKRILEESCKNICCQGQTVRALPL